MKDYQRGGFDRNDGLWQVIRILSLGTHAIGIFFIKVTDPEKVLPPINLMGFVGAHGLIGTAR